MSSSTCRESESAITTTATNGGASVGVTTKEDRDNENDRKRRRDGNANVSVSATPITKEGEMPQKKFYRSRAHCNPLSHNDAFEYPARGPEEMDWSVHFPDVVAAGARTSSGGPTVLDVGCGFGGLTVALSASLPNDRVLGMEIRAKVAEYVRLRVAALRRGAKDDDDEGSPRRPPSDYRNCSVTRTNAMKFLPNLVRSRSVSKLFFCFPDPHFKRKNWPRRIVGDRLLAEYARVLTPGEGRLYAVTDVEALNEWHERVLDAHPLFEKLDEDEANADPCYELLASATEEGKKVRRAGAAAYRIVYRRRADDEYDIDENDFWREGDHGVVVHDNTTTSERDDDAS